MENSRRAALWGGSKSIQGYKCLLYDGQGSLESYEINLFNQLLFQQFCPKINPWGCPCSCPTPGSLWCLDLTQMVLAVRKKLKSTHLNIPNNFCFNNFAQKSIPGVVLAEVLQEPVGASHGHQGRKSGVPHPFSDPGGQAGSNGTPHLAVPIPFAIPQGG